MAPRKSTNIAPAPSQGSDDVIDLDALVADGDLGDSVATDGLDSAATVGAAQDASNQVNLEDIVRQVTELQAANERLAEDLAREKDGHSKTKSSMDVHVSQTQRELADARARLAQLAPLAEQAQLDNWNMMTDAQKLEVALADAREARLKLQEFHGQVNNMLTLTARQQELAKKAEAVGLDPSKLDLSNETVFWEQYAEGKAQKVRQEMEGSVSSKLDALEKQMEELRKKTVPNVDMGGVNAAPPNLMKAMDDVSQGRITPAQYNKILKEVGD